MSAAVLFQKGDEVEYFSVSSGGWISAKVLACNPDGTYRLDVKSSVPPEKVRPRANNILDSQNVVVGRGTFEQSMSKTAEVCTVGHDALTASAGVTNFFSPGEEVEYHSTTNGRWVATKVITRTSNGMYDLECRSGVPPEKIRPIKSSVQQIQSAAYSSSLMPPSSASVTQAPPSEFPSHMNIDHLMAKAPPASPSLQTHFASSPPQVSAVAPSSYAKQVAQPTFSLDEPTQLLSVRREGTKWWYEVCPEGAQMLQSQGSRHIAIISICGLYRTGKSYILNLLLERVQRGLPLFQVGSTTRACTEGLWLWGSTESADASSPLLAFIDCEGFGSTDSDRTRDAQLMTLCALLSSVLVLNTKGALNESIFNALSLVCRFAEHVEERGNEASRPALLWLLRDFQLDLLDPNGKPISPADYLEQALHAAPLASHDAERGQAAREVRQSLLKFFSQRSCQTLVRPVIEEGDLQRLEQLPFSNLRPEFRSGIEGLKHQLLTKCSSSAKTISGQLIGCAGFVGLLQQLVAAMNESQILSVKGAWDTVQHTACGSLSDELRSQACKWLRTLASGQAMEGGVKLPMPDLSLGNLMEEQRRRLRGLWDQRAVGDEATRMEYWRELVESLAPEENLIRESNNKMADQQLAVLCDSWRQWLDDEHGQWEAGDRVIENMADLMLRVPAPALARAAATSLEAAGRQITKDRSKLSKLGDRVSGAEALNEQLSELQRQINETKRSEEAARLELQSRSGELSSASSQRQQLLTDLEAARNGQSEARQQQRLAMEKATKLQGDLDIAHAKAVQGENERATLERAARTAHGEVADCKAESQRLDMQLKQLQADMQMERQKWTSERETLRADAARATRELEDVQRSSAAAMRSGQDQMRAELDRLSNELRAARQEIQTKDLSFQAQQTQLNDAKAQVQSLESAKNQMREQVASIYREQAEKEKSLRQDLEWVKEAAAKSESTRLAADRAARKARWEADTAMEQQRWMEAELSKKNQVNVAGDPFLSGARR